MAKKAPPPTDDDEDEDDFTPRQLEVMNNTISAAVTSHLKRGLKPIQDQLTGIADIKTMMEAMANGGKAPVVPVQGQQPAPGAPANQPAPGNAAPDPEVIAMRKRVQAMEDERTRERTEARNAKRDAQLTEIATTHGVDKHRVRGAVAILREQVKFDAEGNPIMSVKRNGFDEDVDVATGAAEFFKTDEGKAYIAPTQGARGGSGSPRGSSAAGVVRGQPGGAGGNAPAQNPNATKQEKKAEAANALMGAVGELLGGGNINVG